MKFNRIIIILFIAFFINSLRTLNASATDIIDKITGIVVDSKTNKPISDVVITVEGTDNVYLTDDDGKFSINDAKGKTLVFSQISYNTIEIKADKNSLKIRLEPKDHILHEVVVNNTNVNDIDMRKIAGSITTVDMNKLTGRSEMNLINLLQGQVPGLVVSYNGELGTKPTVRIRGESSFLSGSANEPLYVLDGIIISADAFLAMNPQDFDQIKVLKDAAATALYGIKAANGVIEIKSKRGVVGKPTISVDAKYGITFRGTRGVKMMDSKEKLELERLLKNPSTPGYFYSEEYIREKNPWNPNLEKMVADGQQKLDSLRAINTDWFKDLIKNNTYQSYSIGIRGGSDKNTYYYSINYGKQGGRMEGNDIQRITLRSNQDYNLTSKMHLSFNIGLGFSKINTPRGSSYDPTTLVYNLNPYEQKIDPKTGIAPKLYSYSERTYNDLVNQYKASSTSKRMESSLVYHWNIWDELEFSAVVGGDYLLQEDKAVTPATAYSQIGYPEDQKGELRQNKNTEFNLSYNIRVNYNKVIYDHNFMLSANTDYLFNDRDNLGIIGYGLPIQITTGAGINQGLTGRRQLRSTSLDEKTKQFGFGMAGAYSYRNIYDIYGSYKRDASSLLPADKRWNTAWASGLGWQVSNYGFLKDNKVLTNIRFRASYGYTAGMAGITAESTIPVFNYTQTSYGEGRIVEMVTMYNDKLRPQQSHTTNIGGDIQIFQKITFGFDLYNNRTKDAILSVPIAPSTGFTTINENIGTLSNSGYELKLAGDVVKAGDFRWNTAISVSWNKNKVISLYDGDKLFLGNDEKIPQYQVGKAIDILYGLKAIGIHPLDGRPRFINSKGKELSSSDSDALTADDMISLGHSIPPYSGFFNNTVTYKQFSLSFDFYISWGGIAQYSRSYVRDKGTISFNAVKGQTRDMWFQVGDEGKIYPKAGLTTDYDILRFPSTNTIYKTDFIRLNNLQLSYRFTDKQLKTLGNVFKYAYCSVQGQNLFTIRREIDKASLSGVLQPVLTFSVNMSF